MRSSSGEEILYTVVPTSLLFIVFSYSLHHAKLQNSFTYYLFYSHYDTLRKTPKVLSFFNDFNDFLDEESMWQLSKTIKPQSSGRPKTTSWWHHIMRCISIEIKHMSVINVEVCTRTGSRLSCLCFFVTLQRMKVLSLLNNKNIVSG